MSRPFPDDPFLCGNYAPWPMEGEVHDLVVVGDIPRELDGTLYRNGPNPQFAPRGRYHWFDGDGMLHAFTLRGGKAHYRNRWVRTERFALERRYGEALFGGLADFANTDERAQGVFPNAANTNVIFHAGRLLALWEGGPPYELDPATLETRGVYDFDGTLHGAMTAHPKRDPDTDELLFFGYGPFLPYLRYAVAAPDGTLTRNAPVEIPVPTMQHDFAATRDYLVFMVFPATLRAENLTSGSPVRWEPELGTRIGVLPRRGDTNAVVWFETEPCFVFHVMNAYADGARDGQRLVLDVCRFDRLPLFDRAAPRPHQKGDNSPTLTRWTLDLRLRSLRADRLDDRPVEFPRLDERYAGLPYRIGYAAGLGASEAGGSAAPANGMFETVVRYDHARGRSQTRSFGAASYASEPVFVPRSACAAEGDGFLLVGVYREDENRSDLVILDAQHIEDEPLATVRLPHRVPFGFHGNWVAGVSVE